MVTMVHNPSCVGSQGGKKDNAEGHLEVIAYFDAVPIFLQNNPRRKRIEAVRFATCIV